MAKVCLDETRYSSPVPMVGVYIAVGTVVCMSFMVFDIIYAFRRRRHQWMPCRLFSLNSVTLTLMSICTKIPVDLTTGMPGVYDQLAKLTGTSLVCAYIGFFSPSIGDISDSESLTNMVALSIFVITISVNISVQIFTGVIHVFIIEHVLVICCMLVSLTVLCVSTMSINTHKNSCLDFNKNLIRKEKGSLLERLKLCYLYGVNANPQMRIVADASYIGIVACCVVSFGALLQAVVRSLVMKHITFCPGHSDYGWSMRMIVMIQILAILVGFFVVGIRWVNFLDKRSVSLVDFPKTDVLIKDNPILGTSSWDIFCSCFLELYFLVQGLLVVLVYLPMLLVATACVGCCWEEGVNGRDDRALLNEYEGVVYVSEADRTDETKIDKRFACKAVKDMNKWMEQSRAESAKNPFNLFSRTNPSEDKIEIEVSCLSMSLVVRITSFLVTSDVSKSHERSFREAYEFIEYIDTRINYASVNSRKKRTLAKAVLIGEGFSVLLPKIIEKSGYGHEFQTLSDLDRARVILKEIRGAMPCDIIAEEVGAITRLINLHDHQTIHGLYKFMEQVFVDMMHVFLVHLPNVIFNEVTKSSAEEFEEKVALALKLLWRIEALEDQVKWLFPDGSNLSRLITPQVYATVDISNENSDLFLGSPSTIEDMALPAPEDVIIEVE